MKHNTEILEKAQYYINTYEPNITQELLFAEFKWLISVHKEFNRYLRKEKIKFNMPTKNKKELARRRVFIHWYIDINNHKRNEVVVSELSKLLMVSSSTIYAVMLGYR